MIPGFIITALTFPGVIVHEFAHQLFCIWTNTRVIRVCYFQFKNPAGYVIHELPNSVWHHVWIGIGPLFVNTLVGFLIGLIAIPLERAGHGELSPAYFVVMWLAISVAMHSFPSTGDAKSIWKAIWQKRAPVSVRIFGTPVVGLIYLGAVGSMVWLDLLYGVAIVIGIPKLLALT